MGIPLSAMSLVRSADARDESVFDMIRSCFVAILTGVHISAPF